MGHKHRVEEPTGARSRRLIAGALVLVATYMVAELVAGILTGSLALLADSGHMLTDAAALGLALFAARMVVRPPHGRWTFGFKRTEILAALANGITLVAIAVLIVVEAIGRLSDPPDVDAGWMLGVALTGIPVALVATLMLARAGRESLNVEGAFRHMATDAVAFIGTAVAALVILLTGWNYADPIASLVVAALILGASWSLLRDSTRVLMEAAPEGADVEEIGGAMAAVRGVIEVHDLHVWTVTSGFPALAAHVVVSPKCDRDEVRARIQTTLKQRFAIEHTTLQVVEQGEETHLIEIGDIRPGT